jgi:hypothetical protein
MDSRLLGYPGEGYANKKGYSSIERDPACSTAASETKSMVAYATRSLYDFG